MLNNIKTINIMNSTTGSNAKNAKNTNNVNNTKGKYGKSLEPKPKQTVVNPDDLIEIEDDEEMDMIVDEVINKMESSRIETKESVKKINIENIEIPKVKLTLKKIRPVVMWEYDTINTHCICKVDLMQSVPVTDSKNTIVYKGDVIIGECEHGYHSSCITTLIKKGAVSCPTCRMDWKPVSNVNPHVYVYNSAS